MPGGLWGFPPSLPSLPSKSPWRLLCESWGFHSRPPSWMGFCVFLIRMAAAPSFPGLGRLEREIGSDLSDGGFGGLEEGFVFVCFCLLRMTWVFGNLYFEVNIHIYVYAWKCMYDMYIDVYVYVCMLRRRIILLL